VTLRPGQQTDTHRYGMAEEAMPAVRGDIAFFPPPVEHAMRATRGGPGLVVVA
jgi:quercetin dioxygenase-like cupin family protein